MSDEQTQRRFDARLFSRDFPCDELQVWKITGRESIGHLFRFEIEVVCPDLSEAPLEMAGMELSLILEIEGKEIRRIHGVAIEVTDSFIDRGGRRHLAITLAPRAFRLSMVETQDLHLDMTVPELITSKMQLFGLGRHTEMRLIESYPKRELLVQYRETDLAFVSRLAEHCGISFFFEHDGEKDSVVFTDHAHGFAAPRELDSVVFRGWGDGSSVFEISATNRIIPAGYIVREYNERTPHIELTSQHLLEGAHPGGVCEIAGNFKTVEEGAWLARVRAEERRAGQLVYTGKSALPGFSAGARFHFEGHPVIQPAELLITEIEHHAAIATFGGGASERLAYSNTFRAIPAGRAYRPPRSTPKPQIAGFVHAIVDPGATGIEKYAQMDSEGRYTLRFLFDTTPPGKRLASPPVRMLQAHAGEGSGMHLPLKPGTEVLVGFVHGDPDRPILVGAVHNPLTPPVITGKSPMTHRLRTSNGIRIDLVDEP